MCRGFKKWPVTVSCDDFEEMLGFSMDEPSNTEDPKVPVECTNALAILQGDSSRNQMALISFFKEEGATIVVTHRVLVEIYKKTMAMFGCKRS